MTETRSDGASDPRGADPPAPPGLAGPAGPPVLDVDSLTRYYGDRRAVDALSFRLAAGTITGLVGPNGAGKTTTMRCIAGVLRPAAGRIVVAGHDLALAETAAKRALALVPDDPALFTNLTVREHLRFMAGVYGVPPGWEGRGEELLRELELTDRGDASASELSRGMRQKTAIACAFLHRPRLLMLDEPLTGLDPRGIRTLYAMLRRAAAEGAAVLVSSHLLSQLEGFCTHYLVLRRGVRVAAGTPEELRAQVPGGTAGESLEDLFFRATEGSGPGGPASAAP